MAAVPSTGPAAAPFPRVEPPEAEATRDLYQRFGPQILSFCFHRLGNREEAEDATQSTFLNAFRGLQRGISPEFEAAWLYKIAHNVCLTRQRSSWRRRRVETPGDLDAIQDLLPARESEVDELIRLPDALEGMPEQQRRALLLREWQGLSYKEIASELKLSQSAVETLLFRARRSLARGLTDEQPLPKTRRRLSAGGNPGSAVAVLKALVLGGGAKIAATVATVAATSIVTATPTVRHDLVHLLAPTPPPAPAKAKLKPAAKPAATHPVRAAVPVVVASRPAVVEAPPTPADRAEPRPAPPAVVRPASRPLAHQRHLAAPPPPPPPTPAAQPIDETAAPAPDNTLSAPSVPAAPAPTEDHSKSKTDQAEPVAAVPADAAPNAKHEHGAKRDAALVAAVTAGPATPAVDPTAVTTPPADVSPPGDQKAGGKSHGHDTTAATTELHDLATVPADVQAPSKPDELQR